MILNRRSPNDSTITDNRLFRHSIMHTGVYMHAYKHRFSKSKLIFQKAQSYILMEFGQTPIASWL